MKILVIIASWIVYETICKLIEAATGIVVHLLSVQDEGASLAMLGSTAMIANGFLNCMAFGLVLHIATSYGPLVRST